MKPFIKITEIDSFNKNINRYLESRKPKEELTLKEWVFINQTFVIQKLNEGLTIRAFVNMLNNEFGIKVSYPTFRRYLKDLKTVQKQKTPSSVSDKYTTKS